MRLAAFILSIIILTLCSMPCADVYSQSTDVLKESSQAPKSSHEEHKDLCSPFCYCACCSTVSIAPQLQVTQLSVILTNPESLYCDFRRAVEIDIYLPIWQPPKV